LKAVGRLSFYLHAFVGESLLPVVTVGDFFFLSFLSNFETVKVTFIQMNVFTVL